MIRIHQLQKQYQGETVLRSVSLTWEAERTLSILGQSGSGKSTLLKIMAGLETADGGTFTVADEPMLHLPPQRRGVVYLSQEPLLFPHLSIFENLAYGLRLRKTSGEEVQARVSSLAERLGLAAQLSKKPHQLSGGQKQRVSFGRALIINPRILLLDEPFGSLDAHTRAEMQALFREIREEFRITALFVTHDLKEALLMGHQIAMMQQGELLLYPTLEAFLAAPESGAAQEIAFWQGLKGDR